MKKIAIFLSVMTLFLIGPTGYEAQGASSTPHIGILIPESGQSESQTVNGLRDGLEELGYREGNNIILEVRNARGYRGGLKSTAVELVSKKIDLFINLRTANIIGVTVPPEVLKRADRVIR